jgi:hypothetical protein
MADIDTTQDDVPDHRRHHRSQGPTHEVTTPPGNPEIDQEKLDDSLEELDKPAAATSRRRSAPGSTCPPQGWTTPTLGAQ